jgi:chromosome segregation ATPase
VMTDLLARQQDHLTGLEERLSHELALLSETIRGELIAEMSDERAALAAQQDELKSQERELAKAEEATASQLQEWSEELARRQTDVEQGEQRLAEFTARETAFQQAEQLLARERAELLAESQDLAAREARLTEREQHLTSRNEHLNQAVEDTLAQRQRIAAAFLAQRKLQAATLREERQEIDIFRETLDRESERTQAALQQQAALRQQQHEQQLVTLRSTQEELSASMRQWQELCAAQQTLAAELQATRLGQQQHLTQFHHDQLALDQQRAALAAKETDLLAREAQLAASCGTLAADQLAVTQHDAQWAAERAELLQRIAALESTAAQPGFAAADPAALAELDQLRGERQTLQAKLREAELNQAGSQTQAAQLRALEAERDGLAAKLAEAEQHAHTAEEKLTQQAAFEDDPQRIQELQKRMDMAIEDVRSLKRKNAELEANLDKARRSGGGGADAHEASGGWEAMKQKMLAQLESQDSGLEPGDRREIEATLRRTDELVAAKDREISDLRELLEQQSNQVGELAVGAAAIAQIMDHDELIMQERERLQHAQEEWREKLKQAEIDISLERARLARERTELQEKQHTLDKQASQQGPAPSDPKAGEKPATRGRWLTRLGLKDEK